MKRPWLQLVALALSLSVALAQQGPANPAARPPLPPLPTSPVATFRMLLATNAAGRGQWLALRTPQQRHYLEEKIAEFNNLTPGEREVRLQTLQLRWYMPQLLKLKPADQDARLAQVPETDRALIRSKLNLWRITPPGLREELLTNQMAISVFYVAGSGSGESVLRGLSPQRRQELEQQFRHLEALPVEQRNRIVANFEKFFAMPTNEQSRVLRRLTDTEQAQMHRTLTRFEILPPDQRQQAMDGFKKFAELSVAERAAFLNTAARWQAMSEAEREKWRQTVAKMRQAKLLAPPHPGRRSPNLAGSRD